jgi:hypothetical protein
MSKTKMEGRSLQKRLCRRFCRYYKASKEENLACMGYLVIESLECRGRELPFPASVEKLAASDEKVLVGRMCTACPFYEDGCDFVKGVTDSRPCGGFIILNHLTGTPALSVDDIQAAIDLMK